MTTIKVLDRKLYMSFVFENYSSKGEATVALAERPIVLTIVSAFAWIFS